MTHALGAAGVAHAALAVGAEGARGVLAPPATPAQGGAAPAPARDVPAPLLLRQQFVQRIDRPARMVLVRGAGWMKLAERVGVLGADGAPLPGLERVQEGAIVSLVVSKAGLPASTSRAPAAAGAAAAGNAAARGVAGSGAAAAPAAPVAEIVQIVLER